MTFLFIKLTKKNQKNIILVKNRKIHYFYFK